MLTIRLYAGQSLTVVVTKATTVIVASNRMLKVTKVLIADGSTALFYDIFDTSSVPAFLGE